MSDKEVTADGRWMATYDCGHQVRVKNGRFRVLTVKPNPTCARKHLDDWKEYRAVTAELGWCGCGEPEKVERMMVAYLTNLNERATTRKDEGEPNYGYRPTPKVSPDAELLIQYLADSLGWTEHGGSVGGAWLTEDGEKAFRNLTKAALADDLATPVRNDGPAE